MTEPRTPKQCDIRGCVGAVEHSFFDMNADLSIKEMVDLCAHHADLIGGLTDGQEPTRTESTNE